MAPQIGFHGLAPRSRAHLCFTMVEASNRRREGGDVSRGFRVSRATDWQGPIGFFVASPFPTWRRTHFPSTLNSCPNRVGALSRLWIPAAARMTGAGVFPESVAVWSGKVGFLHAFAQITPPFSPFFVARGAVQDTNFFVNSAICCHLFPAESGR